jgi:hypothetical protein
MEAFLYIHTYIHTYIIFVFPYPVPKSKVKLNFLTGMVYSKKIFGSTIFFMKEFWLMTTTLICAIKISTCAKISSLKLE